MDFSYSVLFAFIVCNDLNFKMGKILTFDALIVIYVIEGKSDNVKLLIS